MRAPRLTRLSSSTAARELLPVAGLALLAAALFARLVGYDTDFDEGVYLTSMEALRHGQGLGADVFAPQPPGWYALLEAASYLPGAYSISGMQAVMVALAVTTVLAGYAVGRLLDGRLAGLAAGALLVIAPPFPLYAHRVLADIPAAGASVGALALALLAGRRGDPRIALSAGVVLAAAASIKLTALLAAPAFLVLLLWRERSLRLAGAATAGAVAVAAVFVVVHASSLGELWDSVVVYHQDARHTAPIVDNAEELRAFLNDRTPFAWLLAAAGVASVFLLGKRLVTPLWALWAWAAIAIAFIHEHNPLHENHLLILPVVLAIPAGVALGAACARAGRWRWPATGLLALVLAAGYAQQHRRIPDDQIREEDELVWAAETLRSATSPDDLVVSDHPIVPFLADRRVPGALVDTAVLRFATGSLTPDAVLRTLDAHRVVAVVAGRAFTEQPEVLAGIRERYEAIGTREGVTVYARRT